MISFFACGKETKWADVVNRKLFAQRGLIDPADTTRVVVAQSGFFSRVLPRAMQAAALAKWPVAIVPVLVWGGRIKTLQAIAYFLFRVRGPLSARPRRPIFSGLQFGTARARTGTALMGMRPLDIIGCATVFASHFGLRGTASPRTETSIAARLVDREGGPAGLTNAFNLLDFALSPAFSAAIYLVGLLAGRRKGLSANGASSCFHALILA